MPEKDLIFSLDIKPVENLSSTALRIGFACDFAPARECTKVFNKLNRFALYTELRGLGGQLFEYNTIHPAHSESGKQELVIYTNNPKIISKFLEIFPENTTFSRYSNNSETRGAAGREMYRDRDEVIDICKSQIEELKGNITPNEKKKLVLEVKFNQPPNSYFNKVEFLYEELPYRVTFTGTVNNREFFSRDGRISKIKEFFTKILHDAKKFFKNNIQDSAPSDLSMGRIGVESKEFYAASFQQVEKLLNLKTDSHNPADKKLIFRNVTLIHEGQEVSVDQLRKIAEVKKQELWTKYNVEPPKIIEKQKYK